MRERFSVEAFRAHPDAEVFTVGGTEVKILSTDLRSSQPVVGVIRTTDTFTDEVYTWSRDGRFKYTEDTSILDLVIELW